VVRFREACELEIGESSRDGIVDDDGVCWCVVMGSSCEREPWKEGREYGAWHRLFAVACEARDACSRASRALPQELASRLISCCSGIFPTGVEHVKGWKVFPETSAPDARLATTWTLGHPKARREQAIVRESRVSTDG
jgi:hypothetical protein